MKKHVLLLLILCSMTGFAHTVNYNQQLDRHWFIQQENRYVDGTFSMFKNGNVFIEDQNNRLVAFPINALSIADKKYVLEREKSIIALNTTAVRDGSSGVVSPLLLIKFGAILLILLLAIGYLFTKVAHQKRRYLTPILSFGVLLTLYSFSKKMLTTTDPNFVDAAFTPFLPNVATSWDDNYFYVESKGVPSHTMMVGISNHGWQQQVPIPQCYIGNNHWSIPLNPVLAATPIPIDNVHFTRGAIAIAANGVPIFNYHTNTGVDSFVDGQLDNFGGHCGRGDDYHYHIAPLHLYTSGQTTTNLPCAFSFDGYAVYGNVEPDGSPMTALDANHGHTGTNGVYHYHGTATAPYMIANFVGQVTEDATHQLIPQAAAHPVRNENWTPLNGALITNCAVNGTNNGVNLSYTLNGNSGYATNFSWTGTIYSFNYVTPTGITNINYDGFAQCTVPNLAAADFITIEKNIAIYPNPATDLLNINLGNRNFEREVESMVIYDMKGNLVLEVMKFSPNIDIKSLATGNYLVKIQFKNSVVTKKLMVK